MSKRYLDLYSELYNINLKIKYATNLKEIKELYEESLKNYWWVDKIGGRRWIKELQFMKEII